MNSRNKSNSSSNSNNPLEGIDINELEKELSRRKLLQEEELEATRKALAEKEDVSRRQTKRALNEQVATVERLLRECYDMADRADIEFSIALGSDMSLSMIPGVATNSGDFLLKVSNVDGDEIGSVYEDMWVSSSC